MVSQYCFLVVLHPKTSSNRTCPKESNTIYPHKTSFGLLPLKSQALSLKPYTTLQAEILSVCHELLRQDFNRSTFNYFLYDT